VATPPLSVRDLTPSRFPNRDGKRLVIAEGMVVNTGPTPVKTIEVLAVLKDAQGKTVAKTTCPAGRTLSEEELMGVVDDATRTSAYAVVASEASAMVVRTNQAVPFTVVFLEDNSPGAASHTLEVTVAGSEGVPPK
jgi:hypothetical protein